MTTVRMRLTLLYGGLFLASGVVLLVVTYLLVRSTGLVFVSQNSAGGVQSSFPAPDALGQSHHQVVRDLLLQSGIALGIMTLISVGLGWLVAGRVLRPLRTITSAARQLSANNLHQRLAMTGRDDELKELADTFDALLARLEAEFAAQRQFVANASHELRTPLARQRTVLEVALGDSTPTVAGLRETCRRALVAGEEQERLIEALLTLARSQRGLDRHEPIDLAAILNEAVESRRAELDRRGLSIDTTLDAAPVLGDANLLERLAGNLIDNAIRHNVAGGRVRLTTGTDAGQAVLSISNTGAPVPRAEIARLFAPFQRLGADRVGRRDGHGLGLSIVDAIARAHGARLGARPLPDGGLDVSVWFPLGPDLRERDVGAVRVPESPVRAAI
jgi:signal transduction histidine kinase